MYKFYGSPLGATSVYSIYIKDILGRRVLDSKTGKPIFYSSRTPVEPMPLAFPIAETPMCAVSAGGGQVVDIQGKRVCFTPKYTPNPNVSSIYSVYSSTPPSLIPVSTPTPMVESTPVMVIDTMGPIVADTPTPVVTTATPPPPRAITPVRVTAPAPVAPESTPTLTIDEEFEEPAAPIPVPEKDNSKLVVGGILALVIVGGVVAYSMKGKKK